MIRGLRGVLAATYARQDQILHAMTGDTVEPFDLFAEFDRTAAEYGWHRLGQPEDHLRRYGRTREGLTFTVRLYANRTRTAVVVIRRHKIDITTGKYEDRRLGQATRGKRDIAINWLREGR